MTAIWGPAGAFIAALVAGQFADLARSDVHNVDVIVAGWAAPRKSEELAVGRPGRIDDVTHVGEIEFLRVGAVGVHEVELGCAAAIADEGDEVTGLRIPGG